MASTAILDSDPAVIEQRLAEDLVHADQALFHMGPILRHLLGNDDTSIFSDEVIARVRGIMADLARQLVQALGEAAGHRDAAGWAHEAGPGLAELLMGNKALLDHVHMLALEWQLTDRLHGRQGIDPVLPPMLQELIASPDPDEAARGMNLLAAQARCGQMLRRMQLPLSELPHELHQMAVIAMHAYVADDPAGRDAADIAEAALRKVRNAATSRLDLLAYAVSLPRSDSERALDVGHSGAALFLTALSARAGLTREMAIMATTESQMARLFLAMIAAGAGREQIATAFAAFFPEHIPPAVPAGLTPSRAAAMLAGSHGGTGG
ncbi:MAG: hypothetical protein ACK4G2_04500 [Novosphingobium sp.]